MSVAIQVSLLFLIIAVQTCNSFSSAYTYYPEQRLEPKIIYRLLNPDPDHCLQMTWDAYWDKDFPSSCHGLTCYHPYYDGFESPEPATLYKICSMSKGESCIKVTIYDKYDPTRPVVISRSCSVVPIKDTDE